MSSSMLSRIVIFQSTPSVGRATNNYNRHYNDSYYFNPRPPWGGRLSFPAVGARRRMNFNPRPPWGGRRVFPDTNCYFVKYFNPRPPWGGRLDTVALPLFINHFNPRPPWGGRHYYDRHYDNSNYFNPRPPWGGRRADKATTGTRIGNFNPRPPWGGRLQKYTNMQCYACT